MGDVELERALFYIEAYLARQLLAGRSLSPLRGKVMDVMAAVDRSTEPDDLLTALKASDWPADLDIQNCAKTRGIYADLLSRNLLALFRGIERHKSGAGAMFFTAGCVIRLFALEWGVALS